MICLTREVRFSVDRDWSGHVDPQRPATNAWAGWPSAVGVVPYLVLRVTVSGEPDPVTGYLCNIKSLDQLIREHAIGPTADLLAEQGWRMPAEQVVRTIWKAIHAHVPAPAVLERLELSVTPFLAYAIDSRNPAMVELTQQFEFSAAHRLHCTALSAEENRATFGKCNNPNGHGHNYVVEITVAGEPDEQSGVVCKLPTFEETVSRHVIDVLDHKHLNIDTDYFSDLNPSVENIARVIWDLLVDRIESARLSNVRVYETPKTWADYGADQPVL
jgi:6-pyruvoyltetrahydropterin/6-carboxytetrahydropterin synthase